MTPLVVILLMWAVTYPMRLLGLSLGGLQLPWVVMQAVMAHFQAANVGSSGYPFLTIGNANLQRVFASPEQQEKYMLPLVEGRWFGTMALSEPQAGSGQEGFGFCGRILARQAPVYERTTEQMIGTDSPVTVNELTLTPAPGGTLLTLVITYPDAQTRDSILGTGMTDGMEASYARLDSLL